MRKILLSLILAMGCLALAQSPPAQAIAAGYTSLVWSPQALPPVLCSNNALSNCTFWGNGAVYTTLQGTVSTTGNVINEYWTSAQTGQFGVTNLTSVSGPPATGGAYGKSFTYGYFEVSMAFPAQTGNWAALWLLALPLSSPYTGPELDIFEAQSNTPNTFTGTAHTWSGGSSTGQQQAIGTVSGLTGGGYNTYGVLWTPTQICWYFNNTLVSSCVSTTSSPYNAQYAGQYPMYLILSEQPGCNFTYTCSGMGTSLGPMQTQWVHVFQNVPQGSGAKGFARGTVMN